MSDLNVAKSELESLSVDDFVREAKILRMWKRLDQNWAKCHICLKKRRKATSRNCTRIRGF